MEFYLHDDGHQAKFYLGAAAVICRPLAHFSNTCTKIDDMINQCIDDLHIFPDGGPTTDSRKEELLRCNLDLLVGNTGVRATQELAAMLLLPPESSTWGGASIGVRDLEQVHIWIMTTTCDAWRRLVFKRACLPFLLFRGFFPGVDIVTFLDEMISACHNCQLCVDKAFSLPMIRALRDPAEREVTCKLLVEIATRVRNSSISNERKHLISAVQRATTNGKEIPLNASVATYVEAMRTEHKHLKRALEDSVIGTHRRLIAANLRGPNKIKHEKGTRAKKRTRTALASARKSHACNMFIAEKRSGQVVGGSSASMKELFEQWRETVEPKSSTA
jgi:hypothetical protein